MSVVSGMMFSGISLLLVVAVVAVVVYFATRGSAGRTDALTGRNLARFYLRAAFFISLVLVVVGAGQLLSVGAAQVFGRDFSYNPLPPGTRVSSGGGLFGGGISSSSGCAFSSIPGGSASGGFSSFPTPGAPVPGTPRAPVTPQPAPRIVQLSPGCPEASDTRQQDDLARGIALLLTGLVFGVGHLVPRTRLESPAERRGSGLARAEVVSGAVIFGLTVIVLAPSAVYGLIHYLVYGTPPPSPNSFSSQNDQPGPALGAAMAFLPVWIYYLVRLVRGVRGPTAQAGEPPTSD